MSQTSQAFRTAMHVPLTDPVSGNVINIVVPGNDYVSGWSSASGMPEAPLDHEIYARQDASWVALALEDVDILNAIKRVDGAGSGLDADTLDGKDSSAFADKAYVDNADALKLNVSAYTAADVLAKVKTVDGAGSGLDADLFDGQDSSVFALKTYVDNAVAIIDCGTF